MITRKQDALCFSCHDDMGKAMAGARSRHKPLTTGECTKCHSPHKAKLNKLLLAGSPDMCFTCHKTLKTRMSEEKAHSPAARDCLRCHVPHVSRETTLLAQPIQALCAECHDAKSPSFGTAHLGIEAAMMDCKKCQEPHASKDPKFFKVITHAPFASRSCDECHVVGK
jgi:predicted CXXCH cytochrome family protein